MRQIVGKSATKNFLGIRFELMLRTDSPHPCRMSWSVIKRTIVPWIVNIGVTSCPPSRSKIIVKWQQLISRGLQPPKHHTILIMMNPLGFHVRRGIVFLLFLTSNSKGKRFPSITLHSNIAWFSRRQKCMSKSLFCIALRNILEIVTTNSPSSLDW